MGVQTRMAEVHWDYSSVWRGLNARSFKDKSGRRYAELVEHHVGALSWRESLGFTINTG
jgi:hypothetical protein